MLIRGHHRERRTCCREAPSWHICISSSRIQLSNCFRVRLRICPNNPSCNGRSTVPDPHLICTFQDNRESLQTESLTKSMIADEGPGTIHMNRLLAGRRQFARGRFLNLILLAGFAVIALSQPALGQDKLASLTVTKVVTGSLSTQPTTQFTIFVVCGNQERTLKLANGASAIVTFNGFVRTCVIHESKLPPPFTANGQICTWVSSPSQTVTLTGPTQVVTVHNSYQCQGGTGSLVVKKLVTGSLPVQPTTPFTVMVICPTALGFNLANGQSATVPSRAYGLSCSVIENTLPPPFTANGRTCTWYRVSPQTQTVTINSPTQTVIVTNSYNCV